MRRQTNDQHEFKPLLVEIEERPLNPLGRIIFWIIICTMIFAALWMFFGKVDVVVTARGKVIPGGEVKAVQPLNTGVVRSILVAAGDYVRQGQVLLEVDPSDIDPELMSMTADLVQVELERRRIEALLQDGAFAPGADDDAGIFAVQKEIYLTEKQRLDQQIQAKQAVLRQLLEQLAVLEGSAAHADAMVQLLTERLARLTRVKDIISRDDYEKTQSELQQHQAERVALRHQQAEVVARKQQTRQEIAFIHEDQRNRLLLELSEKTQRQSYLQARIEQTSFRSSRQQITAPVDGYVSRLLFHTIGGVVTPAEKLAYIVPEHSPLLIHALLLNKDAGFVTENMAVSIKIDTFNFQKYGVLEGLVAQIAKDSLEDEQYGSVYEIYVIPERKSLLVDGVDTPLQAGMSVSAEIKVGKRRIIEFFLYPLIRYLDEGISVR